MYNTTDNTTTLTYAHQLDREDPLARYRDRFHRPLDKQGNELVYLCGNSLGLQPKTTEAAIQQELEDWKKLGVEGHFKARNPWMPYHHFLRDAMAKVVGAKPQEVVLMNTLSVNLHLMMVSFYRPTAERYKIVIESDAFPSDKYAVESQLRFHGLHPRKSKIEISPRPGEVCLRHEDIYDLIEDQGDEIALIMLGNPNYYTGQFLNMKAITERAHAKGITVGFDCAHGAGNRPLDLHDSGCDFAVWCTYKYLNGGPGAIAGTFVHERHSNRMDLPRFEGWWGHDQDTRFGMRDDFQPMPGADAWQLSNPPILALAPVWASLKIFEEVGMAALREKSIKLTGYLEELLNQLGRDRIRIITPHEPEQRGCQLSLQVVGADKSLFDRLSDSGVIADWREPDVIRVAPTPLYTSFTEVFEFVERLKNCM
ncbi:MAG: kynureninase [Bacteroidota bacterium]